MKPTKTFMTGKWEHLILSTYQVDSKILEPYLPQNTEIDLHKGKALISIVAFTFSKVRFFGIKVPFHQNFGQINFRFYVKSKIDGRKGVVFIKEFAPKPLIALTANLFYNEPYYYKNVQFKINKGNNKINLTYKHKKINLTVHSTLETKSLKPNTLEYFVTERYVAFIKSHKRKTLQYKINHKPWKLYKSSNIDIDHNILKLLPPIFKHAKYISSCFVDGSFVTVEKGLLQSSTTD